MCDDTDPGVSSLCNARMPASQMVVWQVLSAVRDWPVWNPFIEWSSPDDDAVRDTFTVVSAGTILQAELRIEHEQFLHLRLVRPGSDEPPAAEFWIGLAAHGSEDTYVLARLRLERWYKDALTTRTWLGNATPATALMRALRRAVC